MSAASDIHKAEVETGAKLHMGIAEQGKVYALAGDHSMALVYYRQAMHMAVQAADHEIFFRHYLECVMESLEHMEAYAEVLDYCAKAIEFYARNPPPNPMAQRDLAHIYERRGAVQLKTGDIDKANEAFQEAMRVLQGAKQTMPLAEILSRWIKSGVHVDPSRVLAEQKRTHYFSIRSDTVDPSRAIKLPDERLYGQQTI